MMTYFRRAVACALGAFILASPASAVDPISGQRDKKHPTAKAQYISGSGVILLRTDPKSGKVLQATMSKSTGNKTLDAAAVNAFRNQSVTPDGSSQRKLPISFRIRVD